MASRPVGKEEPATPAAAAILDYGTRERPPQAARPSLLND